MGIRELVAGSAITLVIGGSAYTINQTDVIDNFASDTGSTQQQAEDYVKNVEEDELIPYDKLGSSLVDDGNDVVSQASQIDCVNYTYEWESLSLSCAMGKKQLTELGNDEISLGLSYIKLSSESADKSDISATIGLIDRVNSDFDFKIVKILLDSTQISDSKNSNSYNKATLKAALESN